MYSLSKIFVFESLTNQSQKTNKLKFYYYLSLLVFCHTIVSLQAFSQNPANIEILRTSDKTSSGYYFLGSESTKLAIIDLYGNLIKDDILKDLPKGLCFSKQSNGMYSYYNNISNKWYVLNSDLSLVDSVQSNSRTITDFHEFLILPNGNYLVLGLDIQRKDISEIVGIEGFVSNIYGFELQELDKVSKELVWSWNTFDHFSISDATSDISLLAPNVLYCHVNSFLLDTDGNYIISSRHLDELTKINRLSGQIMWRMGGSNSKNNQFAFPNDTNAFGHFGFSHQHDPVRLENGNLLIFDNGNLRTPKFSRVVEYQVDETNRIANKVWEYIREDSLYAHSKGNAQRLKNGNTLIHWNDLITEVGPNGEVVHEFRIPNGESSYRAFKYESFLDVVKKNIQSNQQYAFSDEQNSTDVKIAFGSVAPSTTIIVEKHSYKHSNIEADSINIDNGLLPIRFVVKSNTFEALNAKVYINIANLPNYKIGDSLIVLYRKGETLGEFNKIPSYLNKNDNQIELLLNGPAEIMIAKFGGLDAPILTNPTNNQLGLNVQTTLKWNLNKNASNYRLILGLADSENAVLDTVIKSNYFNVFGLSNNKSYKWKVLAMNVNAISEFSDYFYFQTKIAAPKLTYPNDNSFSFNFKNDSLVWAMQSEAKSFDLQISELPDFSNSKFVYNDINKNSKNQLSLLNGKKYYWRLNAKDDKSSSNWSEVWSFTTIEKDPQLYLPINKSIVELSNLMLVWKQKNLDDKYIVEVSESVGFDNIYLRKTNVDTNFVLIPNLPASRVFYWRVKIESQQSESEWSDIWVFYAKLEIPELSFPKNEYIFTSNSIKLSWDKVEGAKNYFVEIAKDKSFTNIIKKISDVSETEIAIDDLPKSTRYYWRVKAQSNISESNYSAEWAFYSMSEIFVNEPKLNKPEQNSKSKAEFVLFEWDINDEFDASEITYNFQLSINSDFESIIVDSVLRNNYLINPVALAENSTFYWRVKTLHSHTYSNWSEVWSFMSLKDISLVKPILVYPQDLQIIDTNYVELQWSEPNYDGSFCVQISKNREFTDFILNIETYETQKIVNNLEILSDYYWRVASINNSIKEWSDIYKFSTSEFGTTGVTIEESNSSWDYQFSKGYLEYKGNGLIKVLDVFDLMAKKLDYAIVPFQNRFILAQNDSNILFVLYEKNKQMYLVKILR